MAKQIPLYPRIEYAKKAAWKFIIKSNLHSLPVNPFALCRNYGWTIKSVSETEDVTGETDPFDVMYNRECDAKTYLTPNGRYIIIYDDAIFTEGRILWTIAHEIGHIVLKHLEDFEQTEAHRGLTEAENYVLEKEADTFASEFLAPSEVLVLCKCIKKNAIVKLCGLSNEAAKNKEEALKSYKPDAKYEHINTMIRRQFFNFINGKEYYHLIHSKVCPVCKNYIFSAVERFCRMCGVKVGVSKLTKGIIYSDGPEIEKGGKVSVCPKCMNTQISKSETSCKMCGTPLSNVCTSEHCTSIGSTYSKNHFQSSRYCFHCGSKTTFYEHNLLHSWQEAQTVQDAKRITKRLLESDEDTGKVFKEWEYFLSIIKDEINPEEYIILKDSMTKLDYDTLFIFGNSQAAHNLLMDSKFTDRIAGLFKRKLGITVMEVLPLDLWWF